MATVILDVINGYLCDRGLSLRQGTHLDAPLIHARSSTKNKDGKRDPKMHQTKKGNHYCFGAKAHIGVGNESGLVHGVVVTAANVADEPQVDITVKYNWYFFLKMFGLIITQVKNDAAASQSIEKKGASSSAIFKGIPKRNAPSDLLPKGAYLDVRHYLEILREQRKYAPLHHSEIIVTGKKEFYIHAGMPKTAPVRVKEILVMPSSQVEWRDRQPIIQDDLAFTLRILKLLNYNISISFLK